MLWVTRVGAVAPREAWRAAHSKGGKPNSSGWKSCRESSTRVALDVRCWCKFLSGTMTTCMPAARAASTPLGASSNTRHCGVRKKDKVETAVPATRQLDWVFMIFIIDMPAGVATVVYMNTEMKGRLSSLRAAVRPAHRVLHMVPRASCGHNFTGDSVLPRLPRPW